MSKRRDRFETALFAARWDASVAEQNLARYREERSTAPHFATAHFLCGIQAIKDARASLTEAEHLAGR